MDGAVRLATGVTLWAWVLAEVLLQIRQVWHSDRTERTEWRSFVVFAVLTVGGLKLAEPLHRAVPALSYGIDAAAGAGLLVVAWAGIAVRLWAIVTLGRYFRGTVHIQRGHRVVRSGPYRWVRHPSYSGMLLAAAALAAQLGNALSWAVVMVCFGLALAYRIRVEERVLSEALGEEYTSYAAGTSRLIPGVW